MAQVENPGPRIIWKNPGWHVRRDWFTSRASNGNYEVRQQLESGRWALVAVFTVIRKAA